jgi:hypothetical protein
MLGFTSMESATVPDKLQTSGGTTGKPRNTLHGIRDGNRARWARPQLEQWG